MKVATLVLFLDPARGDVTLTKSMFLVLSDNVIHESMIIATREITKRTAVRHDEWP
jgi:hypothetical protein